MADVILSRSGLPQPPQSRGAAAAALSFGEDVSDLGAIAFKSQEARSNAWLQYDLKLKEMAKENELRLTEIEARKTAEIEKDRVKGEEADNRAKEMRRRMGVHDEMLPETDPLFATMTETDKAGGFGGKPSVDSAKYDRYKQDQRRGYIMSEVFARKPEAADDAARGYRADWFTGRMQGAPDTEGVRRETMAEKGSTRHHMGEAGVMDDWGGAVAPTDLSRAKAGRENAAAGKESAQAGLYRAKTDNEKSGKGPGGKQLDRQVRYEMLLKAGYSETDAAAIAAGEKQLNPEQAVRIASSIAKTAAAQEVDPDEAKRVYGETYRSILEGFDLDPDKPIARRKPNAAAGGGKGGAPYADGTRLRGKDGKMYVVKNGKPVLEGK